MYYGIETMGNLIASAISIVFYGMAIFCVLRQSQMTVGSFFKNFDLV
jgi:hypothetical protein